MGDSVENILSSGLEVICWVFERTGSTYPDMGERILIGYSSLIAYTACFYKHISLTFTYTLRLLNLCRIFQ